LVHKKTRLLTKTRPKVGAFGSKGNKLIEVAGANFAPRRQLKQGANISKGANFSVGAKIRLKNSPLALLL
jgi:hypothetical protein